MALVIEDKAIVEAGRAPGEELDFDEPPFSDDDLAALALAADPDEPISPGAVPLDVYGPQDGHWLPAWYMPPVMARRARRWRVPIVWALIAAFLLIDAFGLCICYGQLVAA